MNEVVCAVLVTYNRLESLKIALAHYFDQSVQPAALIIVDNNSSDGTAEYLSTLQGHQNIHCITLPANIGAGGGIGRAMNYSMERINPDYFWILEDDTYYKKDALADLLKYIKTSSYDMISLKGFKYNFGSTVTVVGSNSLQQVPSALLDGSLIKADIVRKIGPPKKEYFMMCDDYEFSLRLNKNGYKIGLINIESANYLHMGGDGQFTPSTLWRGYYSSRNHLLILKEYFSIKTLLSYLYKQSKFLIAAALFAPDRGKRVKLRLLGIWHGLKGIEGKTLDPKTLQFQYQKKNPDKKS
jgi:rhamnopyranosyl-N-acetylglucosaminyl-diphospho-decaprenol beta-1,3/1,4-galactofuranosyltransferase